MIGNGYENLLWKLLLMDNRQGKEIIWKTWNCAGAVTVNSLINERIESWFD